MRGMRRLMAITGLAVLGLTPLIATAAPAGAQDPEYPPGTCQLALSVSVAERGQTVLASTVNCSSRYLGNVTVDLELNSDPIFLASATSGADGLLHDVPFVVPQQAELGQHTVRSVGPGADVGTLVLNAPLTVVGAGGGQQAIRSGGGGSLAFTGSDNMWLVWLALILLTVGTVLVMAARRRAYVRRHVG